MLQALQASQKIFGKIAEVRDRKNACTLWGTGSRHSSDGFRPTHATVGGSHAPLAKACALKPSG
jgi:hypothetical protein